MSQGRAWAGTVAAVLTLVVSLAVAGASVWWADDLAAPFSDAPPTSWAAGVAAKDLAVLPAAAGGSAPMPSAAAVAATLQPLFTDPALGSNVTAHVVDVATGQVLAGRGSDTPTIPASTIKLVTAAAALAALGPTHQFVTRALAGAGPGEVVLVGGGDVTLSAGTAGTYPDAASLPDLAEQVKKALGGTAPTKLTYDPSIFGAPPSGPWDPDILTNGVVAPITGLMTDGGRADPKARGQARRVSDPAATAAAQFAGLLGIPAGGVIAGNAPSGAKELGAVPSMPLSRQVEIMLTESDNVIAEALARHVAIKRGKPATFVGGAEAQQEQIAALGFAPAELSLADGSGLARADKVSPSLLVDLVALAAKPDRADLRAVHSGLPVAAYNGTLVNRFKKSNAGGAAAGVVRVKTGTLRSVSSVAGVVFTAEGRELAVAVLADNVPVGGTLPAQDALDRILAALAACGCR
jgi:D-alanyl-D-alanine carboxypeptidase/D-alanyl-D-alanine-endopeptidase (penicillin-binding protein 4)